MTALRSAVLGALLLLQPSPALLAQDLVVIVNPSSGVNQLTRQEAANIFLGRSRKLPSGLLAQPIDFTGKSAEREQFYQRLVQRDLAEIDAYWARLVFSGETFPPLRVPDGRTAVDLVASNPSAIAFVDRSRLDDRVRVVMSLGPAP